MGISYGFILFIALSALIISVVTLIYTSVYRKHINAVLAENTDENPKRHKPMMSPLKFLLILILSLFGLYLLITCIAAALFRTQHSTGYTYSGDTKMNVRVIDEEQSSDTLLAAYSPEEDIPGYVRHDSYDEDVQGRGNYHFVQYTMNNDWLRSFPEMLVYVEYTGDEKDKMMYLEANCTSSMDGYSGTVQAPFAADPDNGGVWVILSGHNYHGQLSITCGMVSGDIIKDESGTYDLRENMTDCGAYTKEVSLDMGVYGENAG